MVSTGVPTLDNILSGDGYPDKSAILVEGLPAIGKEALGYWFIRSGLVQGDYCLYATHRPVSDVTRDMKGVGISTERVPDWIASAGSPVKCDLRDTAAISFNIKQAVHANISRRVRVATDLVSPLLVLNPLETTHSYWSQLIGDLKQQDCVLFALASFAIYFTIWIPLSYFSTDLGNVVSDFFLVPSAYYIYRAVMSLSPIGRVEKIAV